MDLRQKSGYIPFVDEPVREIPYLARDFKRYRYQFPLQYNIIFGLWMTERDRTRSEILSSHQVQFPHDYTQGNGTDSRRYFGDRA